MQLLSVICVLAVLTCSVNTARILGIFHMPAYSHYQLGDKILKELASRGHEVTSITPYAGKTPVKNFKEIMITGFADELEKMKKDLFEILSGKSSLVQILSMGILSQVFTEIVLNHTNVQQLLKSNEKFDLVIMEQFVNEAFKGFCYHYNTPCIVTSTLGGTRWTNPQMGNPAPPSYVPDIFISYSSNMNFWQRLHNSVIYVIAGVFEQLYTFPKQNQLLQKYFPGAPHLSDLHYNTSLMLMNSHVSINAPVPYVPNMIEIGGYHVSAPKKLPQDLHDYLDKSKHGVIFFSMGSNLKSKYMPVEKREAILKAFAKLKQDVLWKWEDEVLPGQPPNVKLSKWLPQQDILAHPNVKLFITHGGLLSTIEAIYHGKPIVGIPVSSEQELNVANAEIAGYGISVPYSSLSEEALTEALNKVLTSSKYAENVQTRSNIMQDQPMKPLDRAIFWIEYVLRHKGAPHLKTAALNLTWYQYLLLDVIAFVAVVTLVSFYIFYKILTALCCKSKKNKGVRSTKKEN